MAKFSFSLVAFSAIAGGLLSLPSTTLAEKNKIIVSMSLPAEVARTRPEPSVKTAREKCIACHSVDYVYKHPTITETQWRSSVTKMIKVMGADIRDSDIDVIVQYLVLQNGKK